MVGGFLMVVLLTMVPLPNSPDYESVSGYYSTGAGFGDVDLDGDPDLFISNGNDMEAEPNHIYFNAGGVLDVLPGWTSQDIAFSGHLSIGDINADGFQDLAVSNYVVRPGWLPAQSVIYLNLSGLMDTIPFFVSPDSFYSFSCDFGDVDGDGDLDIAFVSGEVYTSSPGRIIIYLNEGGVFDTVPWFSSSESFFYDVAFTDLDLDGDLDIIAARYDEPLAVFFNEAGYDSVPDWEAEDAGGTLMIDVGDVNGDGYPDVVAADNSQVSSAPSRVKLYLNEGGTLSSSPVWGSQDNRQYYSTVSFCDVDGDGDIDIGAGGWWEPVVVFKNASGNFSPTPDWQWMAQGGGLVCEKVSWCDVNMDGLYDTTISVIGSKVVIFSTKPVVYLNWVELNGQPLALNDFCYNLEDGWLSLGVDVNASDTITLGITLTRSPDLLVSNWEPSRGNFLFYNTSTSVDETMTVEQENNFYNALITDNTVKLSSLQDVKVYNLTGRLVMKVKPGSPYLSLRSLNLRRGVYFLKQRNRAIKVIYIP